jgi:hypothetical protein
MVDRKVTEDRERKPTRDTATETKRAGISPAQLARLEANQHGLYVEALAGIAEALRCARDRPIPALATDKLRRVT